MTNQTAAHQDGTTRPYNPHDHLIKIKTKQGLKDYYPAAWRLYELTLRYENANFSSDILLMNIERNLVVVKCRLYLGPDYERASKKTEALKSGPLDQLDKVETAAKARCARDFGIGTEYALLGDDDTLDMDAEPVDTASLDEQQASQGNGHKPARTTETVQAFYAKTYKAKPQELEAQWAKFVQGVTGRPLSQRPLSEAELNKLNGVITQAYQKAVTARQQGTAIGNGRIAS